MKTPLAPHQIDTICARFTRKSPKTFRERPVRNFLGTLPVHTSFAEDYANLKNDARAYAWKSPIVTAICQGLNLAHYQKY